MRKIVSIAASSLLFFSGSVFAQCVPTVARAPGSHYQPINNNQVNIGKGLTVEGHVRRAGDCQPIVGARVAHWQADAKGKFTDEMRAYILTDRNGRYRFSTEWPGANPPRIHFMVVAEGYKTLITDWTGDERKRPSIQVNLIIEPAK